MAAFKVPLRIDQGADFSELFTWKVGKPAAPVDLTGCSAEAHIRSTIDAPAPLLVLSTSNGRITLGGVAGTVQLTIDRAVTELMTWKTGAYDLEITFSNGKRRRFMYGLVTVSPEITRG